MKKLYLNSKKIICIAFSILQFVNLYRSDSFSLQKCKWCIWLLFTKKRGFLELHCKHIKTLWQYYRLVHQAGRRTEFLRGQYTRWISLNNLKSNEIVFWGKFVSRKFKAIQPEMRFNTYIAYTRLSILHCLNESCPSKAVSDLWSFSTLVTPTFHWKVQEKDHKIKKIIFK